ncbi:MAG: hypothetical protein E7559_09435 [Ruminococcaceae bacterium]|nr:hypothetical protein [Oscillospiraceae bacterium]
MSRITPADRDFFDRLPFEDDYPDLYPEYDDERVSQDIGRQVFDPLFELRRRFGDTDERDYY